MAGKNRYLIIIILMIFNGCAHVPQKIADDYLVQAKQSEADEDLVSAFKFYKLAMTAEPSNPEAEEGGKRVEKALRDSAERHYRTGLKLHQEGQYGEARQHFLMTLHLRPDHPDAAKILTERKRIGIKRHVIHTIKSGENLAKIAGRYYGDQSKFSIIASYNNLTDATRIHEGQEIKVPEIDGLEFFAGEDNVEIPHLKDTVKEAAVALPEKKGSDRIDEYRKQGVMLFQENRYQEAIDELNKVLAIDKNDLTSLELIQKSHYELAMIHFKDGDYFTAMHQFRESVRYKDDCATCLEYLQKSEELYKEEHYKKGMQYYEDEHLVEAIKEWELVIAVDPGYKKAGYHIDKTKVMLNKLEEIKKARNKGE